MELYPYFPYTTSWCGQDKLYLFTLILNTLKKGGRNKYERSEERNTEEIYKKNTEEEGNKEGKIRRERSRK